MPTKTNPRRMYASYSKTSIRKNGSSVSGGDSSYVTRNDTVTTGANFVNYKDRIKRGENATTSLSGTRFSFNPAYFNFYADRINPPPPNYSGLPSDSYVHSYVAGFQTNAEPDASAAGVSVSRQTAANNQALSQFVQKAISARRSMQGGVFLGELRQTIAAVRNPAQSIRRGLDDYVSALKKKRPSIRRTRPQNRRQTAQSIVSDTWLEYSFGWAPLFGDVKSAAEALAKSRIEPDRPKTKFVSAKGESTAGWSSWTSEGQYGASTAGQLIVNAEKSVKTSYAVKYYGKVKISHPNSLQAQLGLLPEDFVPTMWELVPWSFLVDYFSNVGDIIQAACFLRSSMAWTSRGTKHETLTRYRVSPLVSSNPQDWRTGGSGSAGSVSVSHVTRNTYSGSFIPTLEFEIPGFGRKWVNMGALASSLRSLRPFHLL